MMEVRISLAIVLLLNSRIHPESLTRADGAAEPAGGSTWLRSGMWGRQVQSRDIFFDKQL